MKSIQDEYKDVCIKYSKIINDKIKQAAKLLEEANDLAKTNMKISLQSR